LINETLKSPSIVNSAPNIACVPVAQMVLIILALDFDKK
jgi:hypothetical protein